MFFEEFAYLGVLIEWDVLLGTLTIISSEGFIISSARWNAHFKKGQAFKKKYRHFVYSFSFCMYVYKRQSLHHVITMHFLPFLDSANLVDWSNFHEQKSTRWVCDVSMINHQKHIQVLLPD